MFQADVPPLDVAKGSETFEQSLEQGSFFLRIRGMPQNSNFRDAAPLLSARGERPRGRCAGEKRHELTAAQDGCASVARMDKRIGVDHGGLAHDASPGSTACPILRPAPDQWHSISPVVLERISTPKCAGLTAYAHDPGRDMFLLPCAANVCRQRPRGEQHEPSGIFPRSRRHRFTIGVLCVSGFIVNRRAVAKS